MKRRRDGGESGTGNRPATRVERAPFKKQQQHKRGMKLGGGGLSLEAFAAAKTKPTFSQAQVKEQREFYKNAKKVQKYKKLVSQLGLQGRVSKGQEATDPTVKVQDSEMANDDISIEKEKKFAAGFGKRKPPLLHTDGKQFKTHRKQPQQEKGLSQMEKAREEVEKQKLEKKEMRAERELYDGQQRAAQKAQADQKAMHKAKLRKRTQGGQPVMKHHMERLLETIQRGS